jgi:hypothetical protein
LCRIYDTPEILAEGKSMKVELDQEVRRSRAQSTGETIVVIFKGKGVWQAKSLQTGETGTFSTRRAAEIAMSKPETWNQTSAKIFAGELPKYDKSKDVVQAG